MKKLGKLQINSEKLMKNEELLTLRGGYDGGENCNVSCTTDSHCIQMGGDCNKCRDQPELRDKRCSLN